MSCKAIIQSGNSKGQRCKNRSKVNGYCGRHKNSINNTVKSSVIESPILNEKIAMTNQCKEYFKFYNELKNSYIGKKICLLYQSGSFFELFDIDIGEGRTIGNVHEVAEIMNLAVGRKNLGKTNEHFFSGFKVEQLHRYLKKLIKLNYIVRIVEQDLNKPTLRTVSRTETPSTYYEESKDNILMVMYIEKDDQNYLSGISTIDLSTGKNYVYEVEKLDDITRICLSISPREVIIYAIDVNISDNELINQFNIGSKMVFIYREKPKCYKISVQNRILNNILKNIGQITPIEYLNLERYQLGSTAYTIMLNYAYQHNENILNNIPKPKISIDKELLVLDNNTILQLNIFEDKNEERVFSLYNIINNTQTALGRRMLKRRLTKPILNSQILNWRYDQIEKLYNYKNNENILRLNRLPDFERIHRKIILGSLEPQKFLNLHDGYQYILNNLLNNKVLINIINKIDSNIDKEIITIIEDYNKVLDLGKMNKSLNKSNRSFFKSTINKTIDNLQTTIELNIQFLNNIVKEFSKTASVSLTFVNGRYFITTTNKRSRLLKNKEIYQIGDLKLMNIRYEKRTSSTKKIIHPKIEEIIDQILDSEEEIKKQLKIAYVKYIKGMVKYSESFKKIERLVAEIDYLNSGAITAFKNRYTKPIIDSKTSESYIDGRDIRHPILEQVRDEENYVPNDIKLNNEKCGMILSGINASGKSSLLKAVGLNIVLAQMGYFVASSNFKYSPFELLMSKTNDNDNIYLNKSSFVGEIIKLKSILEKANKNTLILVDELCRGCDHYSAVSLVASAINIFSKRNLKFILTTHLHKIFDIDEVTILNNIQLKYLKIEIIDDKIIYNRKLAIGKCPPYYGVEVARSMGLDIEFMRQAEKIRKKILGKPAGLFEKKSVYNSKLVVDYCKICESTENLETHHIIQQKLFDEQGYSKNYSFHKNSFHNLVILCKLCHIKVHQDKIEIEGYKQTNKGLQLIFKGNQFYIN